MSGGVVQCQADKKSGRGNLGGEGKTISPGKKAVRMRSGVPKKHGRKP